jgi:hypothetical protein
MRVPLRFTSIMGISWGGAGDYGKVSAAPFFWDELGCKVGGKIGNVPVSHFFQSLPQQIETPMCG